MRPIAVDLFAGVGGFSLGLEQAGFDVAVAIERDPVHAATYKYNFPESKVLVRDIREITGKNIRQALGHKEPISLVVGGPPCQGFSMIGKRKTGDSRNSLIFEFLRIVRELKPKYFVMENVEGLAQGEAGSLFGTLWEEFRLAGYNLALPIWRLDAKDFEVPQSRKRLFLVGAKNGLALPMSPTRSESTPKVKDAIGDIPDLQKFYALFKTDRLEVKLREGSLYSRRLRGLLRIPGDYSHPRLAPVELTGLRRAVHAQKVRRRFLNATPGEFEPVSRFFKLDWNGVCHTLRAGTGSDAGSFSAPRPIHPKKPRCIVVREAARLHGFPDWFSFHTTIWHGFRQVGNSVAPPVARSIGASIRVAMGYTPRKPIKRIPLGERRLLELNHRNAVKEFHSK